MADYTWYGHDLSYFSRKLESALTFYGAPFERVEVKLGVVTEEARKRAGTHVIPVLETPEGWALWDTTPIMFMLDGRFPKRRMFADGEMGVLIHMIENFLDEWLGRTVVHYRWHYPECASFAAPVMAMGNEEVAKGIAAWGLKACRATGVEPLHQQAMAEVEYERILASADRQLQQTRYLMGEAPCAVDAVILGGLRAHTMVDPVPRKLVDKYPRVRDWALMDNPDGADAWDGSGSVYSTEFAQDMLIEIRVGFEAFALGNKAALEAGEKLFTANVYDEDVTYLARPYPEKARQMVTEHILREGSEAYVRSLGLGDLYL